MVTLNATDVRTEDDLAATEASEANEEQQEAASNGESQKETETPTADTIEPAADLQPAESGASTPAPAVAGTVTPEAQQSYDDLKAELEQRIGGLAIDQARLKLAIKANREAMGETTGELDRHIIYGPERHPLFDRQQSADQTEGDGAQPTGADDNADDGELPPDAVSEVKVHMLKTITQAGVDYAVIGTVVTAYVDEDGDIFLARYDEEAGQWRRACLVDDEYELPIGDQSAQPAPPAETDDSQPAADNDESWRQDRIADVLTGKNGVTKKILEILDGHDIRTMGELADAPRVKGCELSQLKGLTANRLEKIDDATAAYWAARKAAGK